MRVRDGTGPDAALLAALEHPDVRRLRATLAARPGGEADTAGDPRPLRFAAVAVVLRVGEGGALELLLVKRAEYDGDPWSGHVALPGGRREPDDATLWDTAVRETWEETGLELRRDGVLLGTLDELHPRTPALPAIVVRPHVVVAAPRGPMVLSPEVASSFWVPVGRFGEPGVRTVSTVRARGLAMRVPSFVHEAHVVWGLTHRIVTQLLERLGNV